MVAWISSADYAQQFAGKMTGTIIVEPLVQRFGFKTAIYVLCAIQFVGCTRESLRLRVLLTCSGDGNEPLGSLYDRTSPSICDCWNLGKCR